jgi:AAA domain
MTADNNTTPGAKSDEGMPSKDGTTDYEFVPSTEWQDVPDWAVLPNGGEYDMARRRARWDNPPPPETVTDKRTGKPQRPLPRTSTNSANSRYKKPNIKREKKQSESDSNERDNDNYERADAPANGKGSKEGKFDWLKFESYDELPQQEPEQIIKGILHVGEKFGITAGSKRFKTWLLLYLAYCVANGFPFLGYETKKSKVAIFDLELSKNGLRRRLARIRKALGGKGDFSNIKICALRGKARKFCQALTSPGQPLQKLILAEEVELVIIDPVYKFLLGRDENSNGIVADILEGLTEFCDASKVALAYVHHHSKGSQAHKDPRDRGAGAGAWSRDPDCLLDLTEQDEWTKDNQVFSAEFTLRDFPPIENFVVRWKFPLVVLDETGLDPHELKQPAKGGRPPSDAKAQILTALRTAEVIAGLQGLTAKQMGQAARLNLRTIQRHLKTMLHKEVEKCVSIDGYQLSINEREKSET